MDTQLTISTIKNLLQAHADYRNSANRPYRAQTLFDDRHHRYALIDCGWSESRYFYSIPIHLEIINSQIWIHHDDTDPGIAVELRDRGIPAQQIILGFRPPHLRQHTGFGVETATAT